MRIDLSPQAQKDIRRFGWDKTVLLELELHDLRDDPRLPSRLKPLLPIGPGSPRFRIDLTEPFVARVRITGEGLEVECVVTTEELNAMAAELFPEELDD